MTRRLTEKQRLFVEAYTGVAEASATRAAEIAGYAHPHSQGPRLLTHVGVIDAIEEARSEVTSAAIATREQRQAELTRIMLDRQHEATKDRLKAIELLGKMQGDFVERRHLTHDIAPPESREEAIERLERLREKLGGDV